MSHARGVSAVVVVAPAFEPGRWRALPGFEEHDDALVRLATCTEWPNVDEYQRLLGGDDVCFVAEDDKLAAGLDASDMVGSYIARCVEGPVPTRTRNLHDLMNALVWARFPIAKRALARRQMAVGLARGAVTDRVRSRAQDRLAMVDEGGVVVDGVSGREHVFGHALLEDTVRGRNSRGFPVVVDAGDGDIDARLAATLTALRLPADRT